MNKEVRTPLPEFRTSLTQKHTSEEGILHFVIIPIIILFGKWKIEEEKNMFKFTLRAARVSCGYTEEEVAGYCGIKVGTLEKYEKNTALIPVEVLSELSMLFNVPLALIFIGTDMRCFRDNRNNALKYAYQK